jgi:regulator of sigma E protease
MFVATPVRIGVGEAIVSGFTNTAMLVEVQVAGIVSLIARDIPVQGNLMGPVGIVDLMYTQAQQSWLSFLNLAALLTVAVGFLNLLPLPPLDGSRLLILAVEGIVRRQLGKQREFVLHLVGMLVLLSFVLFLTFKDIQRLIAHHGGTG